VTVSTDKLIVALADWDAAAKAVCTNSSALVEAYFERALAISRRQHAKLWELRAAMSLARFSRSQGKQQQARELLAPVYGWFTEGFDTLDLKEAKGASRRVGVITGCQRTHCLAQSPDRVL
jgi:predicted ATPase